MTQHYMKNEWESKLLVSLLGIQGDCLTTERYVHAIKSACSLLICHR